MTSVCFTGHRPKQLFGTYNLNNPKATLLVNQLMKVIERLIVDEGADTFISGGALGADQLAFICVHSLKKKYPHIRNVLAAPYREQALGWEKQLEKAKEEGWKQAVLDLKDTLKRYARILELADEVVYVDEVPGYAPRGMKPELIGKHSNAKLQIRNVYMVDHVDKVIAIFDGSKGGTYNCIETAKKKGRQLIYLDPKQNFQQTDGEQDRK